MPTNSKVLSDKKKLFTKNCFNHPNFTVSVSTTIKLCAHTGHEFQFFLIHFVVSFFVPCNIFNISKCQLIMMAIQSISIKYSFRLHNELPNCSSKQCDEIYFTTFTKCIRFWSHSLENINEQKFHILWEFHNYFAPQIWLFDNKGKTFLLNNSWKYVNKNPL